MSSNTHPCSLRTYGRVRVVSLANLVAAVALFAFAAVPAFAQDPFDEPTAGAEAEAPATPLAQPPRSIETRELLTAKVGAGRLLTLPESVERVALADEAIARVQIISEREVLLSGLAPGQTTLYVWLHSGRRLKHLFQIGWDLELLERVLRQLDPDIRVEQSIDGEAIVLVGEVTNAEVARRARQRAESLLLSGGSRQTRIIDLLDHPDPDFSPDERLRSALRLVDPRIRVRRLQVGPEPDPALDTYILEGQVRDVSMLVQALTLAERQLGGTGVGVVPVEGRQDFTGGHGRGPHRGFQGPSGVSNPDRLGGLGLSGAGGRRAPAGLAAEVSRGLVMMTQSGRVVSFLEVDSLPQILVSIRILEIDRGKAKRIGVNFRIDTKDYSIGSFTGPQTGDLPELRGQPPTITDITGGNLAFAFIDNLTSISAAIDFLEDRQLARSVAEPNVLTLTGEQASVVIGGEIPVPTTAVSDVAAVQGFFFEEFGIRLDIRPTVDSAGVITLEVSSSIRRPTIALGISGVPGFTLQSVQTSARVYSGQSLVIGGLLDFQETLEERRLPLLGKIPLFRWRRKSRGDTELLFLISPRLVEIEAAEGVVPMPPVDSARIQLPELQWPGDRDDWRNDFDPLALTLEGLPPSFLREPSDADEMDPDADEIHSFDLATTSGSTQIEVVVDPAEIDQIPVGEAGVGETVVGEEDDDQGATDRPPVGSATAQPESYPDRFTEQLWVVLEAAQPCLRLRPEPVFETMTVDCLAPGSLVLVAEEQAGWMRVELADGLRGWVAGVFLAPTGTPSDGLDPDAGPRIPK